MDTLRTQSANGSPDHRGHRHRRERDFFTFLINTRIAAVFAIALVASSALAQSSWEQQGMVVGPKPKAKSAHAAQREQMAAQQQAQAAALRAQQATVLDERQEVTTRVYEHFPRPVNPQNRIVEGKIYAPEKSNLWMDLATNATENCSSIKVTAIGKLSIGCEVYKEVLDDGGKYGVYRVIGEEYVKHIFIFHHPAQDAMTTGMVIYEGRFRPRGKTPTTRPFFCMRIANWRTDNAAFEAYDCGLPDTAENRKKAGIPIPTPKQLAAAQEEIATALKELDERTRAAEHKAAEQEAAKKKAAEEAAAQQEAARADAAEQRAAEAAAARQQAAEAAAAKKKEPQLRALNWNMEQAAKGDSYGLLRMGQRYRDGDGVPKDLTKAREYFTNATAAGSPDAAGALAKLNQASTNPPATKP